MLEDAAVEIFRTEVDGVPVFWNPADGPLQCGLVFRVGMADETLATSGITHLVEHLAMFATAARGTPFGAFVNATQTVFFGQGEPEDVSGFLRRLCRTLCELPLDRIEAEKRVLRAEREGSMGGGMAMLRRLRFGASGHGLVGFEELGLRRLDQDDVSVWAGERFTRDNAALYLTGTPPPDLELPLGSGRRIPPPSPDAMAELALPAYAAEMDGAVAMAFVAERSSALVAGLRMAEDALFQRLRLNEGLIYETLYSYEPLTATFAHAVLGAACVDRDAPRVRDGMLAVLQVLAEEGPADQVLADYIAKARADLRDRERGGALQTAAVNELMGRAQESQEQLASELDGLSAASIADAVRAVLGTAIIVAPKHTTAPAGYYDYQLGSRERLPGQRLRRRGWRGRGSDLVFAPEGISLIGTAEREPITVRYEEVAALVYRGADRATVVGIHGESIYFNLRLFADEVSLREQLESSVPSDLVIRVDDPLPLSLLILDKLESPAFVKAELEALPRYLREDETVLNLGRAERGREHGLAILTDHRVLYLSTGYTGLGKGIATTIEIERDQITKVGRLWPGISAHSLDIRADGIRLWFRTLTPKGRAAEFTDELQATPGGSPNRRAAIEAGMTTTGTDSPHV